MSREDPWNPCCWTPLDIRDERDGGDGGTEPQAGPGFGRLNRIELRKMLERCRPHGTHCPLCRGHNARGASQRRSPKFGDLPLIFEG